MPARWLSAGTSRVAQRREDPYDMHLPTPPDDLELYSYRYRHDRVMLFTSLALIGVFWCLVKFSLLFPPWSYAYLGVVALMAVFFGVNLAVRATYSSEWKGPLGYKEPLSKWPSVDVFLPSAGEALELLHNTYEYVSRLDYPGVLNVYALDDSGRDSVRQMARGYGFTYLSRPNRGEHKKAGNLVYAYARSEGDWILILDADFVPRHDMVTRMVQFGERAPDAGIVQSPQWFRVHKQQNWLERGASMTQELFYRNIQVARDGHGSPICVGTCALYRRRALSDSMSDTGFVLIGHSEDVHTGFAMYRGSAVKHEHDVPWRVRYFPFVMSAGLCPDELRPFFTQQYRWAAGSLSLAKSGFFWKNTPLTLHQRMSYMSGFLYYIATGLFIFLVPIPVLVLVFLYPQYELWDNYLPLLPSFLVAWWIFPAWHSQPYTTHEVNRVRMVYSIAHLFALIDTMRGRLMGWKPTNDKSKARNWRYTMAMVVVLVWGVGVPVALLAGSAWRVSQGYTFYNFLPVAVLALLSLRVSSGISWTWMRSR